MRQRPAAAIDIAAGHGRHVRSLARIQRHRLFDALLRDYDPVNLDQGRKLIQENGLTDHVRFEVGDAFDRASLAGIKPRPNVVIVSGLYELFSDNSRVRASLAGIAEAIETGGYLIYTNQPWHPQLEFIARRLYHT